MGSGVGACDEVGGHVVFGIGAKGVSDIVVLGLLKGVGVGHDACVVLEFGGWCWF